MNKQVPVVSQSLSTKHWPTQHKIIEAIETLDRVKTHNDAIYEAYENLVRQPSSKQALHKAKEAVHWYKVTGTHGSVKSGAAQKLLDACRPVDWWDANSKVRKSEIAKMVALLVGSFPTSNVPDPAVFTAILIDDLIAADPDFAALECTCRKIRKSQRFMPAICEIVAELEKQQRLWNDYDASVEFCDETHAELVKLIEKAEQEMEARTPAPEVEHKPAAPLPEAETRPVSEEVRPWWRD